MLTGPEIKRQVELGRIVIDPFNEKQLNPNSYDVRLGPTLRTYIVPKSVSLEEFYLDPRKDNPTYEHVIPECGFIVFPGHLYLGSTVEQTSSDFYIPMLSGKSSLGRYGVGVHVTAGFGDCGFTGTWTMEIHAVGRPVLITAGMRIAQICWHKPEGEIQLYKGRYQGQQGPTASRSHWGENP